MKTVIFTVDVEQDLQPYSSGTTVGIVDGLPPLLDLLDEQGIHADFFFQASILNRHGSFARKTISRGHGVGSHGWSHDLLCEKHPSEQREEIARADAKIEEATGTRPRIFRAPNFSISGISLEYLSSLGYVADSSVMPLRVLRRWRIWPIYDFRDAPLQPYRPSGATVIRAGRLRIIEVPLAVNRDRPGTPLGTGSINAFGVERTLRMVVDYPGDVVVLLTHPWELIDLGEIAAGLPEGYARACSSDLAALTEFLSRVRTQAKFSSIEQVFQEWTGRTLNQ